MDIQLFLRATIIGDTFFKPVHGVIIILPLHPHHHGQQIVHQPLDGVRLQHFVVDVVAALPELQVVATFRLGPNGR